MNTRKITKAEVQTALQVLQPEARLRDTDRTQLRAAIADILAWDRKAKAANSGTRPGKKAAPPEQRRVSGSILLTDAQWARFRKLGTAWLVDEMARAVPEEEPARAPYVRNMSEAKRPSSIRLTEAQWVQFKALGVGWLIQRLENMNEETNTES